LYSLFVYYFAATHGLVLLKCGIFVAAVLMNASASLPRVYPTYLRGTGESFAANIGGRVVGTSAALLTTQLVNVMPRDAEARLAYSAATVAVLVYSLALVASFWVRARPRAVSCPTELGEGRARRLNARRQKGND